jgi:hypothetical protein
MPKIYMHVQTVIPAVGEQAGRTRAFQVASRLEELNVAGRHCVRPAPPRTVDSCRLGDQR